MNTNTNTGINTTELTAPDIVCGGCANAIKKALANVDGIKQVDVDVNNKTVRVEHSAEKAPRERIAAVLENAGFPVSEG